MRFLGDLIAAAFTDPAGTLVAGMLKGIGKDFTERQLSPRKDIRVGIDNNLSFFFTFFQKWHILLDSTREIFVIQK
ncbi:hypothetical protein F4X90_05940 [Candidatus Poribacteria bacterium]|nr:hypothetical protein [Candidatus Poribacteria bacterium]